MYIALLGDFEVTDVIDLSIGSGAAAIGAQYKQCQYFGVCYNNNNMCWVRRLLQESFLNLVADGSINVDRAIVKNVKQYFQHTVLESRHWRPSHDTEDFHNLVSECRRTSNDCGRDDSDSETEDMRTSAIIAAIGAQ